MCCTILVAVFVPPLVALSVLTAFPAPVRSWLGLILSLSPSFVFPRLGFVSSVTVSPTCMVVVRVFVIWRGTQPPFNLSLRPIYCFSALLGYATIHLSKSRARFFGFFRQKSGIMAVGLTNDVSQEVGVWLGRTRS